MSGQERMLIVNQNKEVIKENQVNYLLNSNKKIIYFLNCFLGEEKLDYFRKAQPIHLNKYNQ